MAWIDEVNAEADKAAPITVRNAAGHEALVHRIKFDIVKPRMKDGSGKEWDQTHDAADNMRYAHSLGLPEIKLPSAPRMGRAIIIGGGPSLGGQLEEIRRLAADSDNKIFSINWAHTWLINNGIIPHAAVMFEIDVEPGTVLKAANSEVTYYICSHCSRQTFDQLAGFKRVLWHSIPNSEPEKEVFEEIFKDSLTMGGGCGTLLRAMSIALALGYRCFDLFGIDSSFPDGAESTHVDGYETQNCVDTDAFDVFCQQAGTEVIKRFKTVGYLALQAEEFKEYCRLNHHLFALRVHGDGMLGYAHRLMYGDQYV